MIEGVIALSLVTHDGERGFFREIVRASEGGFTFGQASHSRMRPGVIKAWHIHKIQTDWWYVVSGAIKAVLHDMREHSPTKGETAEILMGDDHFGRMIQIPPGVAHGCKALTDANLLYITSHEYNPVDEGRIPHDDPGIGYDWPRQVIT